MWFASKAAAYCAKPSERSQPHTCATPQEPSGSPPAPCATPTAGEAVGARGLAGEPPRELLASPPEPPCHRRAKKPEGGGGEGEGAETEGAAAAAAAGTGVAESRRVGGVLADSIEPDRLPAGDLLLIDAGSSTGGGSSSTTSVDQKPTCSLSSPSSATVLSR